MFKNVLLCIGLLLTTTVQADEAEETTEKPSENESTEKKDPSNEKPPLDTSEAEEKMRRHKSDPNGVSEN